MIIDAFLLRALGAGLLVAAATGPLGCFVVWRRMAYFGDATAHAAVLGVAMALAVQAPIFAGTMATAFAMAFVVSWLTGRGWAMDTVLGVMAHSALALGLVAVAMLPSLRINLESYLFGDILAVTTGDLWVIGAGTVAILGLLAWRWEALLTSTLNEDLAYSLGMNPRRERMVLTLVLAICVAVAIKIVGALLIGALLIIPAATARLVSRSPEGMAAASVGAGMLAVAGGLGLSIWQDTPAGPGIVVVGAGLFGIAMVLRAAFQQRSAP